MMTRLSPTKVIVLLVCIPLLVQRTAAAAPKSAKYSSNTHYHKVHKYKGAFQHHHAKASRQHYYSQNQQQRNLQQPGNNNDKNNDKNNNDKNNDKNAFSVYLLTDSPTTLPPTLPPTVPPSLSPVTVPPPPTLVPTMRPTMAPVTTDAPTVVSGNEAEEAQTTDSGIEEDNDTDTDTTSNSNSNVNDSENQVTLGLDELRDIQYFGGGEISLRFSLWFQDGTLANQVPDAMELAVLHSVQTLLCQDSDDETNNDDVQEQLEDFEEDEEDNADHYFAIQVGQDGVAEDRQLCVVKTDLAADTNNLDTRAMVEGSVLLQPPTTYVVDRTAATTNIHWTTWRVTFSVLRLGTFYILQGLENVSTTRQSLSHEEIYRAGVEAMQQVLELALQVSIREESFDQLVAKTVLQFDSYGLVLSSVYGEEVATFEPKLELLGIPVDVPVDHQTVVPTTIQTADDDEGGDDTTTDPDAAATTDGNDAEEDDAGWDDDHYSLEYGITETLDPPFWHTLRIVGIVMFLLTVLSIVGLSYMSKKRLQQRARERRQLASKEGLLNNPQGVEDMLRRTALSMSNDTADDDADAAAENNLKSTT